MRVKKVLHDFISFVRLVKKEHPSIVWIILLGAFASASQPFVHMVFYSRILDKVLAGSYNQCIADVTVLLLTTLVLGLIASACKQAVVVLKEACYDTVHMKTVQKAFTMEYEEFEKTETMDAIRRVRSGENGSGGITSQIQSIYNLTQQAIEILFSAVFVVLLFCQVDSTNRNFFASQWSSMVIIAAFAVVLYICTKLAAMVSNEYFQMSKKNEHSNSVALYILNLGLDYKNGKDIRIYSMQNMLNYYFSNFMKSTNKFYIKWGEKNGINTGIAVILAQIGVAIAYIIIGAKAIYGVISAGEVIMYAGAMLQFTQAIKNGLNEYTQFSYRMEYLKTYDEFINKPNIHYDGTLPIEKRADAEYEFTFEDVCFKYPGTDALILDHVNLKFKIGEKFAVVGRNGAGKTTLIKLLCRLYEPTSGRILLNGIDIKLYDYTEYTKVFSVVFQDFKLLSLPLGENVSSGEPVDEDRMWEVLEQVGMKDRVSSMPAKLNTQLYKNNGDGVEISGGEAQKLAIARALYKDGPFVILDEPTAALDPISEAEIYENFNELISGKTAIYISHRMSSCKFCDNIVVLDKGKIAEKGNHKSLLDLDGIYAALYNTQAQYYS